MQGSPLRVEWSTAGLHLEAREPSPDDIRAAARNLAAAYNEPHNRAMMANTTEFSEADVALHYAEMAEQGARQFLLFRDGALAGDADFRNVTGRSAEFAILIGSRAAQGKGLGTRFATLLHAAAFRAMGLERVYVTILPQNVASRRLFERLGYTVDLSPAARAYAEEEGDVAMSIGRREFERGYAGVLEEVRVLGA